MAEKRGRKSQFSRADVERIGRLRAEGWSDERIGVLFNTHRTTISRLRHSLDGGELPAEPESALDRMLERGARRRAVLDRINDAHRSGDAESAGQLWAEVAAL